MLFAHLKGMLILDRLQLRGLTGATDEFTLAATVQNLRRMVKLFASRAAVHAIGTPEASNMGKDAQ